MFASPSAQWHAFPTPLPSDGGQCQWRGGAVGCGPTAAAALLRYWAQQRGHALPERDALALALAPQMGAWLVPLSGGQRAVQPWRWLLGLNSALEQAGYPLRARGHWGVRPKVSARLAHNWRRGIATIGLEFSPRAQHYGLLSAYRAGPQGVEGQLVAPLVGATTLYLQPRLGLGGVFWLEEIGAEITAANEAQVTLKHRQRLGQQKH